MKRVTLEIPGKSNGPVIELAQGDITREQVDAIVNAANRSLLGGGGVDGAIHRAAGPELLAECRGLGGCETGDAKITRGYALPAQHVIHTVGPVYRGGAVGEGELLARAYRRSLEVAAQKRLGAVAFPSISTGAFRFPIEEAARIAIATVRKHLAGETSVRLVRFVLFSERDYEVYERALAENQAT